MIEKDENIQDVLEEVAKLAPDGEEAPEPAAKAYAKFINRIKFKFSQNLIRLIIYNIYTNICVQNVFHLNIGSRF